MSLVKAVKLRLVESEPVAAEKLIVSLMRLLPRGDRQAVMDFGHLLRGACAGDRPFQEKPVDLLNPLPPSVNEQSPLQISLPGIAVNMAQISGRFPTCRNRELVKKLS